MDLSGERVHVQVIQCVAYDAGHLHDELRLQQRGFITTSGCGLVFGLRQLRLQVGQSADEHASR